MIQIKSRWSNSVRFELETDSIRVAVEAGVRAGADLGGADLGGADLRGADLGGAKYGDAPITIEPIQVIGLTWFVLILDRHIKIGCELHTIDKWEAFDTEDWIRMGGKEAAIMQRDHFPMILALARSHEPA